MLIHLKPSISISIYPPTQRAQTRTVEPTRILQSPPFHTSPVNFDSHDIEQLSREVATAKAEQNISECILSQDNLKRALSSKNEELGAGDEDLVEALEDAYHTAVDDIDDEIDDKYEQIAELERQIGSLSEDRSDLDERKDNIDSFLHRLREQRSAEVIELYKKYEDEVEKPIAEYKDLVCSELQPEIAKRFQDIPDAVASLPEYTEKASEVFEAARSGAKSYEAYLDYSSVMQIERGFEDAIMRRKMEVLNDSAVDLPEPTEKVEVVPEIADSIAEKLSSTRVSEIDEADKTLLDGLYRLYQNGQLDDLFEDVYGSWEDMIEEEEEEYE